MKRIFCALTLLLLFGCGGGGTGGALNQGTNGNNPGGSETTRLTLSAREEAGAWRVDLRAPEAIDLYQIAGTLDFASERYEVLAIEAGGGLGGPEEAYFLGSEREPGSIAFAYTRQNWGGGTSGDLRLLSLRVRARDRFNLQDFRLRQLRDERGRDELVVRDGHKRPIRVRLEREVR